MITTPPPPPVFVQHPARPTWGHCIIVAERDGKIHLQCEDGEEHAIAISHRAQLVPVTPTAEEVETLVAQIQGRRSASAARAARELKKRNAKVKTPTQPLATFAQQVERFRAGAPNGFTAPREPSLARAGELLSAQSLSGDGGFAHVQELVAATAMLHPMEGQIPLRAIAEAHRAPIVAALHTLLHGSGDYAPRFDAYVAAFAAAKTEGGTKGPSWPLMTLMPSLAAPTAHVFVKPKLFQQQARVLALPLDYVSLPSGAVYEQFRAVARAVEEQLRTAGMPPRDLMDVTAFIASTLASDKSAPPPAAAPETTA